jgi:HEAT repeat protein
LAESLKDQDANVRQAAAAALGEIAQDDDVAIPAIVAALQDPSEDTRSAAAQALGKFGSAAVEKAPALVAALKDENVSVRMAAVKSLAAIELPKSLEADLRLGVDDHDIRVRRAAAEVLGREKPQEADNLEDEVTPMVADFAMLMKSLSSGGADARRAAAGLIKLCRIPEPDILEARTDPGPWLPKCARAEFSPPAAALRDPDTLVRRVAAEAMASLGEKATVAIPNLVEALNDRDLTVKQSVEEALSYLGAAAAPAVPALVRALRQDPDSYWAYTALQMIGPAARPAVSLLVSIFSDKHAELELRERAAEALLTIDPAGEETQSAFKEALTDPLTPIRELAAIGLKKD